MRDEVHIHFERYPAVGEVAAEDAQVLSAAKEAISSAYAPYSKFHVGAAALLSTGEIMRGSNQENAAFSQCVCAEQNVLSTIGAMHPEDSIVTVAVTAAHVSTTVEEPVFPCGSCRQILAESRQRQDSPIRLILQGATGDILIFSDVLDILPFAFKGEMLI